MNPTELKNKLLQTVKGIKENNGFLDCSPSKPVNNQALKEQNPAYYNEYSSLFGDMNFDSTDFVPWGSTEISDANRFDSQEEKIFTNKYDDNYINNFIPNKIRQINTVEQFFKTSFKGKRSLCIDVSGGSGEYSIMLAKYFDVVIQCDLFEPNLLYSQQRHEKLNVKNIILLKVDYLQLPDLSFLEPDLIICFDTLIRGIVHDEILIANLKSIRKDFTELYVDFYNVNHNFLNRILKRGYLKDNYGYTLSQFISLYWRGQKHRVLNIRYDKNIAGMKVSNPFQPTFYLVNIFA